MRQRAHRTALIFISNWLVRIGLIVSMAGLGTPGARAVELRWSLWAQGPEEQEIWNEISAMVTEEYPDITLRIEVFPWEQYWDKFIAQASSNTLPDIISVHFMYVPQYAERGAIAPIDDLIAASPELNYADFYPAAQDGLTYKDKVYGLTSGIAPYFVYYNKELVEAAGIEIPADGKPMSYAAFKEAVAKTADPDKGIYGFATPPDIISVMPFIWSEGGLVVNASVTESLFDSPEIKRALTNLFSLYGEGGGYPLSQVADVSEAYKAFAAGKVAFYMDGSWQIGEMNDHSNIEWDIMPVPAGTAGSVTWSGTAGFAPSRSTPHREAAWKAISVITGTRAQQLNGASGHTFPSRATAFDVWLNSDSTPPSAGLIPNLLFGEGEAYARPLRVSDGWSSISNMFKRELAPAFLDPQVDIDELANRVDAALQDEID